jgi:hypothetical protein
MNVWIREICSACGMIMLWCGILTLLYFTPVALCVIAASLLLIPETFYLICRKPDRTKEKIRALLIIILLAYPAYGIYRSWIGNPIVDVQKKAEAEFLESQKKAAMKRFTDNREFILKGIRRYYEEGNYRFAYAHADEFMYTNDPELVELHEKAKQKMIEKGEFRED